MLLLVFAASRPDSPALGLLLLLCMVGGPTLVAFGAVWSKPIKEPAVAVPAGESETWNRILEVPLTGNRRVLLLQIEASAREIQADVDLLPFESLKPAAQGVVDQQRRLIPEIRQNLHLAEWLEHRVDNLERRAAGELDEAPARPRPEQSLMGITVEAPVEELPSVPVTVIPLDPAVRARLAEIRTRVAQMDDEAEHVARLLIECEANLLATISERDERRLGELFAEFAEVFDMHYQAVREVNQATRGAEST
jgi:hypothetical protein